jgi:hypothetical protein
VESEIKFTPLEAVMLSLDELTLLAYQFHEHVLRPHYNFHIDRGQPVGCPTCLAQKELYIKLRVAKGELEYQKRETI